MARDFIHESVQVALEKDGWTITHDPFTLETGMLSKPRFFKKRFEENNVKLIIVNIVDQIIVKWIH